MSNIPHTIAEEEIDTKLYGWRWAKEDVISLRRKKLRLPYHLGWVNFVHPYFLLIFHRGISKYLLTHLALHRRLHTSIWISQLLTEAVKNWPTLNPHFIEAVLGSHVYGSLLFSLQTHSGCHHNSHQRQTARLADSCPSANERYRITRIVHKEYSYYKQ